MATGKRLLLLPHDRQWCPQETEDPRRHIRVHPERCPSPVPDILKLDYEPGCKRRVNTNTYLECLHSPNMHLAKELVVKIEDKRVVTDTGAQHDADVFIYATSFATQKWLYPLQIKGASGRDIQQVWAQAGGAEAHKGTVVADFPNFFILYGPNAGTGQHSVVFHSECQINYSCRLLRPVLKGSLPADSIEATPEAQKRDLAWSWWMDPETRKNTFIYPDPMYKYWLRTIFPTWTDFEIRRRPSRHASPFKTAVGTLLSLGVLAVAIASLADKTKALALWRPFRPNTTNSCCPKECAAPSASQPFSNLFQKKLWTPGKGYGAAIAFAVLFGFFSGGYASLISSVIAQISPLPEIGFRTALVFLVAAAAARHRRRLTKPTLRIHMRTIITQASTASTRLTWPSTKSLRRSSPGRGAPAAAEDRSILYRRIVVWLVSNIEEGERHLRRPFARTGELVHVRPNEMASA
ncbi:hypothetical protein QBC33DRAFT_518173 [Phialemonium atrogriseum]|uniref:Uncharacterized protein n=1 Tax=Phialemonium atrogriseum TaxID=1093897 RepID=A0AAJ0BT35_9PEZI|nr:uncharacterized protein QBC33DRAFT_518173 [Phialemonium atrogriseum]KAK1764003.1 hypothetical protein QBC33DRAFT_518173 [Phialemonium atrogriseum]